MHTNALIKKEKKHLSPQGKVAHAAPHTERNTSLDTIEQTSLIQPRAEASCSSAEGFHGVLGVDLVEQGEVGWEPLLAETDARQRLRHLVEQDLVSCRREVEPVAASWHQNVIPGFRLEEYTDNQDCNAFITDLESQLFSR